MTYSCFLFVKPFKMRNKNKQTKILSQLTVYSQQATGRIWPVGCSLLTPVAVSALNYTHCSIRSWVCAWVPLHSSITPHSGRMWHRGTGVPTTSWGQTRQYGVIYNNWVLSPIRYVCITPCGLKLHLMQSRNSHLAR